MTAALPIGPLIRRPAIYRRKFKAPNGEGQIVAEFHEDKLVLRKVRGRKRAVYPFAQLWALHTGELL